MPCSMNAVKPLNRAADAQEVIKHSHVLGVTPSASTSKAIAAAIKKTSKSKAREEAGAEPITEISPEEPEAERPDTRLADAIANALVSSDAAPEREKEKIKVKVKAKSAKTGKRSVRIASEGRSMDLD